LLDKFTKDNKAYQKFNNKEVLSQNVGYANAMDLK